MITENPVNAQSALYKWCPNPLAIGLGTTRVKIDTAMWSWKLKNPGLEVDSVRSGQFSHPSISISAEVLSYFLYYNSNINFAIPPFYNRNPNYYSGRLNQSFTFRIGMGPCIKKRLSIIPTAQFETSNMYINSNGTPTTNYQSGLKGTHYYAYIGTLYAGFGIAFLGSITDNIGAKISYQKNKIYFTDNYGNNEKAYLGPRRILDCAIYVKKLPKAKKNIELIFRYQSIKQHFNAQEMNPSKPTYGYTYNARPGANMIARKLFIELGIPIVWTKKVKV